jgi:diguanylate cyclase (GGDEF)-like protein
MPLKSSLLHRLRADRSSFCILLVDYDKENKVNFNETISLLATVVVVEELDQALAVIGAQSVDILVIGRMFAKPQLQQFIRQVSKRVRMSHFDIVVMDDCISTADKIFGLQSGLNDIIPKSTSILELFERMNIRINSVALKRVLDQQSQVDPLTGLGNFEHFQTMAKVSWAMSLRQSSNLSLLLIDIDDLRVFNHLFGYHAGDQLLISFANVLSKFSPRATDATCRLGANKFAILLNHCEAHIAQEIGNNILDNLSQSSLSMHSVSAGEQTAESASIGCADIIPTIHSEFNELYERAEKALADAKRLGKARLVYRPAEQRSNIVHGDFGRE